MAKSQKHGNKEAKKPKQIKAPAPVMSEGLLKDDSHPSSALEQTGLIQTLDRRWDGRRIPGSRRRHPQPAGWHRSCRGSGR